MVIIIMFLITVALVAIVAVATAFVLWLMLLIWMDLVDWVRRDSRPWRLRALITLDDYLDWRTMWEVRPR